MLIGHLLLRKDVDENGKGILNFVPYDSRFCRNGCGNHAGRVKLLLKEWLSCGSSPVMT